MQTNPTFYTFSSFLRLIEPRSQIQDFKVRSLEGRLILVFSFFPGPKALVLALNHEEKVSWFISEEKLPPQWKTVTHPIGLFFRSHFLNQRLGTVVTLLENLKFVFEPSGYEMGMTCDYSTLKVDFRAGMKMYNNQIKLGIYGDVGPPDPPPKEIQAFEKKEARLVENVRKDFEGAKELLEFVSPLCDKLKEDPTAWSSVNTWTESEQKALAKVREKIDLPTPGKGYIGLAMDRLFAFKKKMERKVQKSSERLLQVQAQGSKVHIIRRAEEALTKKKKPQGPGIWVDLPGELKARVGRSQTENSDLLREASSRDLWFHVRGQAGAHVWIPRGQPGFGNKDTPSQAIIHYGCQLALWNSKARSSGSAFVDWTEKRQLRAIKGNPGAVEILRSQVLHTKVDEKFQNVLIHRKLK